MSKARAVRQIKKPSAARPAPAPNPWYFRIAIVLTGLCLLGLFSDEIKDTDFWWHLKTGQYITENHKLPVPDPFAYTTAVAPATPSEEAWRHFNLTHEWLAEILMYAVYALAGFSGNVLARALILSAICALSGIVAARLSSSFAAGIGATAATAVLMTSFVADRPGLITFLGVAAFVTILELRRGYQALPVLALIWANCHGGFFLGWVVLAAYCVENRKLWPWAAASILASGINPNGFSIIGTLFAYRRSPMIENLLEWMPPKLWGPPYAYDLLLYGAALVLILAWRRVRLPHWILFAAFAAASLTAFRNVPLIGFLAPVLIAAYVPWRPKWTIPVWAPALAGAVAFAVILSRGGLQNMRVAAWTIPRGAADYLAGNHITGPIFNTYEQGGYLIWRLAPETRVFIDGRSLSDSVYRDYKQILFNGGSDQMNGARLELLNRYGVQAVVMDTIDYVSGAVYPLALALANPAASDWQLAYEDSQAVVFLRNPPSGTQVISNKLGRVLKHFNQECETYIQNSPGDCLCARVLGNYWRNYHVTDAARHMLSLYLEHATRPDPQAEQALRDLR